MSVAQRERMERLRITSTQSPVSDPVVEIISRYLAQRLQVPAELVLEPPWTERLNLLSQGQLELGWICGLPYIRAAAIGASPFEPLVAPVVDRPRYDNKPIYFSDVIVRRESAYRSFADLKGATWAYNEPGSHSGYGLTRSQLAVLGEPVGYFAKQVQAGSHLAALDMVLNGDVDASSIDSMVLEGEARRRPGLMDGLRVIETLGPSPAPLLVIATSVPQSQKEEIAAALTGMGLDETGRSLLREAGLAKFVRVYDSDYDAIREFDRLAAQVEPW
jgi:phosphonate transport system substrate-binding protein